MGFRIPGQRNTQRNNCLSLHFVSKGFCMNTTVQIYETFRKDNFFASSGGNFLWLPLLFVQENY